MLGVGNIEIEVAAQDAGRRDHLPSIGLARVGGLQDLADGIKIYISSEQQKLKVDLDVINQSFAVKEPLRIEPAKTRMRGVGMSQTTENGRRRTEYVHIRRLSCVLCRQVLR